MNGSITFAAGGTSISADGRYVAFATTASNLAPGDFNQGIDVFVRDTVAGTTTRMSTDSSGNPTVGSAPSSRNPSISGDGRYVAFESIASNLVPGDTNLTFDIFVKDRITNATTRVSVSSGGAEGVVNSRDTSSQLGSSNASISADGRYVAFTSGFTNLVPGDTNGVRDIFVRDTVAGTTTRVSIAANGSEANGESDFAAISADGRYVSFASAASNLVSNDTLGAPDVFVHDRQTGTTTRVSVNSEGEQAAGGFLGTASTTSAISGDGRFIAFASNAANLVRDGFSTNTRQTFLRDTRPGEPLPGGASTPGATGGNDRLTGTNRSDALVGLGGSDVLRGLGGNDSLNGGRGRDILTGGAGRDRFVYTSLRDRGDRITDFTVRRDKIVLTDLLDQAVRGGFRGKNAIAAGYVRLAGRGDNVLVSIDRNGRAGGGLTALVTVEDVSVAQLRNPVNFVF